MEGLVELHDNIMFYLVIILFGVGWIMISIVRNYTSNNSPISHKYLNHGKYVPIKIYFKLNKKTAYNFYILSILNTLYWSTRKYTKWLGKPIR
jgi:hypothetical protein